MKNKYILLIITCIFIFSINTTEAHSSHTDPIFTETKTSNPPPECVGEQGKLRWFYWNNISYPHIENLWADPYFPQAPDGMAYRTTIQTPNEFNENFASMIRGFITVPETGDYTFNIRGDNHSLFYLSSDMSSENLALECEIPFGYWVSTFEHEDDKYESQTSNVISLVADTYYYFELFNKEFANRDYAYVYWKTPSSPDEWRIIGDGNVYDYVCTDLCNPYGTPCDDGDANTNNDIEDGFCGCFGQAPLGSTCIGEQGHITALYYDGIGGSTLNYLENAAIFPDAPTRGEVLTQLSGPLINYDAYGSLVKAFLRAPKTGAYRFSLSADNETKLFLSSNQSTASQDLSLIAHAPLHTIPDTSELINLEAGQYYYVELLHKAGGGGDAFRVYWQLPDEQYNRPFRLIDSEFLYQYGCESICIPEYTPCNDHNAGTSNDQYNATCACIGTPCDTPDCSTAPTYTPYEICDATNQHTNNEIDSWLSCNPSVNPSGLVPNGHWIMYDLQEKRQVHQTHVWNYNEEGQTSKGVKYVNIHYSSDGNNWSELGFYEWPQASGTNNYQGFEGPHFGGVAARYILISALTNWGTNETCSGFSEWKMALTECPQINTPCDDGNPNNFNDVYNADCECVGREEPLALRLLDFNAKWQATNVLIDWQVQREETGVYYEVQRGLDVQNFESIGLLQGKNSNDEKATYQLLDTKGAQLANDLYYRLKIIAANGDINYSHVVHLKQEDSPFQLQINTIQPNPFEESTTIEFFLPTTKSVRLLIFNTQGRLVNTLVQGTLEEGQHQVSWNGKDGSGKMVETGIYYIQLTDGRQRVARKVVKQ